MKQDVAAFYCAECDSRQSAPVIEVVNNISRDVSRARRRVLQSPKVSAHEERHGPAEVLSCADLHRLSGITLIGTEPDALVPTTGGRPVVCHYEVHLLGGFEVPEHFTAARTSLLLPHWHRGCRTLQFAMERMEDDDSLREGAGNLTRQRVRCDLCAFTVSGITARHAALIGFNHAATDHKVGEAACSVVSCDLCGQMEVVAHDLDAPVGTPEWCGCEEALYWGRRLL